jgi:hypothetical protein
MKRFVENAVAFFLAMRTTIGHDAHARRCSGCSRWCISLIHQCDDVHDDLGWLCRLQERSPSCRRRWRVGALATNPLTEDRTVAKKKKAAKKSAKKKAKKKKK